ncbi:MAG TPA: FHA domain-containing protein [Kofleriaceae bacterium]|nr:FHA domain-containing protein [Kofleriaceae bacterium]
MQPAVVFQLSNANAKLDSSNPRIFIGRDASTCALATPEASVSRRHAEVFLDNGQVYIRDLGSSNGTWVNGSMVGPQPVALAPNQQIYVGHVPLSVEWSGPGGGRTMMATQIPPELLAMIQSRQKQAQSVQAPVPANAPHGSPAFAAAAHTGAQPVAVPEPSGIGVGGADAPLPAELSYRRQGSNNNGVLLIALGADTFSNSMTVDGFIEFTALDNETVNSITIELVECHKNGPRGGHVWDQMIVRQGPWKTKKGDILPMPFQLRIPPGTSASGRDVHWEIRGYVDISFAFDVEATSPINMRNMDIERIRDALGALDYRIADIEPAPLGQRYTGQFQPPANMRKQLGLSALDIEIEYLGSNLKFSIKADKRWKRDKKDELIFELARLRQAPLPEISQYFQGLVAQLMQPR